MKNKSIPSWYAADRFTGNLSNFHWRSLKIWKNNLVEGSIDQSCSRGSLTYLIYLQPLLNRPISSRLFNNPERSRETDLMRSNEADRHNLLARRSTDRPLRRLQASRRLFAAIFESVMLVFPTNLVGRPSFAINTSWIVQEGNKEIKTFFRVGFR